MMDFTKPALSLVEPQLYGEHFRRQLARAGEHVLSQLLASGAAVPAPGTVAFTQLATEARKLIHPQLSEEQRRWLDGLTDEELLTSLTYHLTINGGSI